MTRQQLGFLSVPESRAGPMVNKQVRDQGIAVPGCAGSHTPIVFLSGATAEDLFVERPDLAPCVHIDTHAEAYGGGEHNVLRWGLHAFEDSVHVAKGEAIEHLIVARRGEAAVNEPRVLLRKEADVSFEVGNNVPAAKVRLFMVQNKENFVRTGDLL